MNDQIKVIMQEVKTGRYVRRTIDISNIINFDTGYVVPPQARREKIEEWIKERAEDQHESELELIDFYIF